MWNKVGQDTPIGAKYSNFERGIMKDLSDSAILRRCREKSAKRKLEEKYRKSYVRYDTQEPVISDKGCDRSEEIRNKSKFKEKYNERSSSKTRNRRPVYSRFKENRLVNVSFVEKSKKVEIQKSYTPKKVAKYSALQSNRRYILVVGDKIFYQSKPSYHDKDLLSDPEITLRMNKCKSQRVPKNGIPVSSLSMVKNTIDFSKKSHILAYKFNGKIYHGSLSSAKRYEEFPTTVSGRDNFILQGLKEKIQSYFERNLERVEILEFELDDDMLQNSRSVVGMIDPTSKKYKKLIRAGKDQTPVNQFNAQPERVGRGYAYLLAFVPCRVIKFGSIGSKERSNLGKIVLSQAKGDKKNARILAHKRMVVGYIARESRFFIPKIEVFDNKLTWDLYFQQKKDKFSKNDFVQKENLVDKKLKRERMVGERRDQDSKDTLKNEGRSLSKGMSNRSVRVEERDVERSSFKFMVEKEDLACNRWYNRASLGKSRDNSRANSRVNLSTKSPLRSRSKKSKRKRRSCSRSRSHKSPSRSSKRSKKLRRKSKSRSKDTSYKRKTEQIRSNTGYSHHNNYEQNTNYTRNKSNRVLRERMRRNSPINQRTSPTKSKRSISPYSKNSKKSIRISPIRNSSPYQRNHDQRGKMILDKFLISTRKSDRRVIPDQPVIKPCKSGHIISSRRLPLVEKINPNGNEHHQNFLDDSLSCVRQGFGNRGEIKVEDAGFYAPNSKGDYTFLNNNFTSNVPSSSDRILGNGLIQPSPVLSKQVDSPGMDTRTAREGNFNSVNTKSYGSFPLPCQLETSRDNIANHDTRNIISFNKNQLRENSSGFSLLQKFIKEPSCQDQKDLHIVSLDTEHFQMMNDILENGGNNSPGQITMGFKDNNLIPVDPASNLGSVADYNQLCCPSYMTYCSNVCSCGVPFSPMKSERKKSKSKSKSKSRRKKNKKKRKKSKSPLKNFESDKVKEKSIKQKYEEELAKLRELRLSKAQQEVEIGAKDSLCGEKSKLKQESTLSKEAKKDSLLTKMNRLSPIKKTTEVSDSDTILSFKVPDNIETIKKSNVENSMAKDKSQVSQCSSKDTRESQNGLKEVGILQEIADRNLARMNQSEFQSQVKESKMRKSVIEEEFMHDSLSRRIY